MFPSPVLTPLLTPMNCVYMFWSALLRTVIDMHSATMLFNPYGTVNPKPWGSILQLESIKTTLRTQHLCRTTSISTDLKNEAANPVTSTTSHMHVSIARCVHWTYNRQTHVTYKHHLSREAHNMSSLGGSHDTSASTQRCTSTRQWKPHLQLSLVASTKPWVAPVAKKGTGLLLLICTNRSMKQSSLS